MSTYDKQPKKNKIFYIQPVLAGYRAPIIEALARKFQVYAFYDNSNAQKQGHHDATSESFLMISSPSTPLLGKRLFYQKNVARKLITIRPDAIISFANPRYLSFWLLLIASNILKIKFYSHGQGLYSYSNPSWLRCFMYRIISKYSTKYVCYTDISRKSMIAAGIAPDKLVTVENSLELDTTVHPDQKTFDESGVLFLGRLRNGCRLEDLIKAVRKCRDNGQLIVLHVIGSGELENLYKSNYKDVEWIHWHGAIHDHYRIAEISKLCRIGCYPGDAGLSVVHYFSLGLAPVVHRNIEEHMGPEPSYIIENKNGFLFTKSTDYYELYLSLSNIWKLSPEDLGKVSNNSYSTYMNLNNPPMGDQFVQLVLNNTDS